jgi:methyl-accepting chemotaxis protein
MYKNNLASRAEQTLEVEIPKMDAKTTEVGELQRRLEFLGIDENARTLLRSTQPLVGSAIGPALDVFYRKVKSTPETARFFRDDNHVTGAKNLQSKHWEMISRDRKSVV